MRKIENWANIKENNGFEKLPVGGYIVKILNVQDVADKEYLKVSFDIAEGDKKGLFKKQYDEDTREDKKWPNAGSFVRSYKSTAESMFKGFANAVENSNKNYTFDFNEKSLVGKQVGIVVGLEEYVNQKGAVRERTYVSAVRSVDTIKKGDFKIPDTKKLDPTKTTSTTKPAESFVNPFSDDTAPAVDPFASSAPADDSNPFGDDDSNPFS
jgi:hypothetical protein